MGIQGLGIKRAVGFTRAEVQRAKRLLAMEYQPEELAAELGCGADKVRRVYLPAGCPHRRDEAGRVWVVGTVFRRWALVQQRERSKRPSTALPDGWAYCTVCYTGRPVVGPITVEPVGDELELVTGRCADCDSVVHRGRPRATDGAQAREALVNRGNYFTVKRFLDYQLNVRLLSEKSVKRNWGMLRHLLEWARETPLPDAPRLRPVFPVYLAEHEALRNYKRVGPLARATQERACSVARCFYRWARREDERYRDLSPSWIESLRPRNGIERVRVHEVLSIEDVRALLAQPHAGRLADWRDRAAIAFLFLSGMRVGAFVTLPIEAVDVGARTVRQWPELGVETKGGKAATTFLLGIPDLLGVVAEWDALVRAHLPPSAPWYPRLSRKGRRFADGQTTNAARGGVVRRGLRRLCERAAIPYRSTHKLRHGHATYALGRARTVAELKAVSQNLMHTNLSTTDSVYAILSDDDVGGLIAGLGSGEPQGGGEAEALRQQIERLERLVGRLAGDGRGAEIGA